jgi:ATP-dependent Clp protease adaptor protein ClpS
MPTTTTLPGTREETKEVFAPMFHVVLLDDDEHTYDYVIEMLQSLFLLSRDQAYHHAVEVDSAGRTIVLTADLPVASFAKDQIHGYGADWRIPKSKGSMSAILEPACGPGGQAA